MLISANGEGLACACQAGLHNGVLADPVWRSSFRTRVVCRAQTGQGWDEVRVGDKRENIDTVSDQFGKESDGHEIEAVVLVVREHSLD